MGNNKHSCYGTEATFKTLCIAKFRISIILVHGDRQRKTECIRLRPNIIIITSHHHVESNETDRIGIGIALTALFFNAM